MKTEAELIREAKDANGRAGVITVLDAAGNIVLTNYAPLKSFWSKRNTTAEVCVLPDLLSFVREVRDRTKCKRLHWCKDVKQNWFDKLREFFAEPFGAGGCLHCHAIYILHSTKRRIEVWPEDWNGDKKYWSGEGE